MTVSPQTDHPVDTDELDQLIRAHSPGWHDAAACASADPELFFGGSSNAGVRLCERCPVSEVCFWSAMLAEHGANVADRHGLFGGSRPRDRASIAEAFDQDEIYRRLGKALGSWADRPARWSTPSGLADEVTAELDARRRDRQQRAVAQRAAA